jgi:Holliday junction resolvase RusA-like endonuclease
MSKAKNKTVFSFPPKVKQRPRMTRRGRVFTPAQTLEFEALVREGWEHELLEGDISVTIFLAKDEFHVTVEEFTKHEDKTKLRGDIDNYAKSILDGLNGTAFVDDKFIRELIVIKS